MRRRLSERIREVLAMPPHPGLVLLRDAFHDDARYFLISDWVDGERWGTRPLPVAVALDQLAQIADVLEFLRARRPSMVHGALSPERLVVRPDGRVCVHGLATSLLRARRGPAPAAVVPFLAPEVLAGEEPTPASDLYSLAALAMHLLTGLSPASAAEHGLSASPREAALITHVLRTGLAHDPVLRPPSPVDFVRRLRARLTATLPTGTVTFLLTDVCDSTRLWDTNPQTMVTAVERYEQLCTEVVDRFGGFHPRDQGEGDSHFVVFRRAADAVACAVELQRRLGNEEWPTGAPLKVRIALHSGEAKVRNGNYRGIAVNTCARLRSLAHGGQIVLSPALAEAVRPALPPKVRLRDVGLRTLRGVARPMRVFQLVGDGLPADLPAPGSAAGLPSGDLIGHDEEMSRMFSALDTAIGGVPQVVLLSGPSGVGKSQLCVRLAEHARLKDVEVYQGRCSEQQGAPAYWPWLQVMREMFDQYADAELRTALGDGASDVVTFLPELRARIGEVAPLPQVSSEAARFRLFESLTSFVRKHSARRPLLIVLEDVQSADQPSVLLLEFLSAYLHHARVLLVVTYHDPEPSFGAEGRRGIGGLLRLQSSVRIGLSNLTKSQVSRYIEADAGVEPPPEVVHAVYESSGGNPFYVKEIVRLLAAENKLLTPRTITEIAAPHGVREVILRRVGLLPDAAARVLRVAAVIGRTGPLEVLAHVVGYEHRALLEALDQTAAAEFLTLGTGALPHFVFPHSVVRQALYESVGQAERAGLHLVIAEALESRPPVDSRLPEIAHHLLAAAPWGAIGKAGDYARRAAREAVERSAYEEGARLYRAARLAPRAFDAQLDTAEQCDLLLAEGEAWWRAGEATAARAALGEAAHVARERGDGTRLARAALTAGELWVEVGLVDEPMVAILRDALALLDPDDGRTAPVRAQLHARLAMELSYAGGPRGTVDHSGDAVELARRCGDRRALAFSLLAYRYALVQPARLAERLAAITESIELAASVGDCELVLRGRALRAIDLLEKGDLAAARSEMAAFTSEARALRQPFHANCSAVMRGMQALMAGRFADVESATEQVLAASHLLKRRSAVQAAYVQLFFLRREQGRLAELVTRFAELAENDRIPGWQAVLALAHLDLGHRDLARRAVDTMLADGLPRPVDTTWLPMMAAAAETAAALRDRATCDRLHAELTPFADRAVVVGVTTPAVCLGSMSRYLGLLAAELGDLDAADAHFDRAIAANRALGVTPALAHCRFERAALLLRRGGADDLRAAAQLLSEAAAMAERCGMHVLERRLHLLRRDRRLDQAARQVIPQPKRRGAPRGESGAASSRP
ncbi:AAA family ATPase [Streptomyces sp. A1-5]|uniref:AAA family ATPase n=1 Tax=Streptomyces sp. A1-5 TaxID=2738410 RepID=UPI001F44C68E|nr:AAA family ATPase [Streptomyces sp. A1-5]UJB44921.1 AAA family ATPase [Streptomyces sp. A1-5]